MSAELIVRGGMVVTASGRRRADIAVEGGRITFPVHEVTIAGNLKQMLLDVDAVGSDLIFRGSSASPTLRMKKMTLSGS